MQQAWDTTVLQYSRFETPHTWNRRNEGSNKLGIQQILVTIKQWKQRTKKKLKKIRQKSTGGKG